METIYPAGRRAFLFGAGAFALTATTARGAKTAFETEVKTIEAEIGGRIGVAALDTGAGTRLAYRAEERFAMASTFKWALAAFVLSRVDTGEFKLGQPVAYGKADLLAHAPVTEAHVGEGKLSIEALLAAIVEVSDNGAANLLLKLCGGPGGLTRFLRSTGDPVTRLDRTEMELNANLPGDPRDTTTPAAMVATMRTVLLGDVLSAQSRQLLISWLKDCATGQDRLRAGLPRDWAAGDKTGTGENGAINDLAIAWPSPDRAPILIACYMSGSKAEIGKLNAAHAKIASLVATAFAL